MKMIKTWTRTERYKSNDWAELKEQARACGGLFFGVVFSTILALGPAPRSASPIGSSGTDSGVARATANQMAPSPPPEETRLYTRKLRKPARGDNARNYFGRVASTEAAPLWLL